MTAQLGSVGAVPRMSCTPKPAHERHWPGQPQLLTRIVACCWCFCRMARAATSFKNGYWWHGESGEAYVSLKQATVAHFNRGVELYKLKMLVTSQDYVTLGLAAPLPYSRRKSPKNTTGTYIATFDCPKADVRKHRIVNLARGPDPAPDSVRACEVRSMVTALPCIWQPGFSPHFGMCDAQTCVRATLRQEQEAAEKRAAEKRGRPAQQVGRDAVCQTRAATWSEH